MAATGSFPQRLDALFPDQQPGHVGRRPSLSHDVLGPDCVLRRRRFRFSAKRSPPICWARHSFRPGTRLRTGRTTTDTTSAGRDPRAKSTRRSRPGRPDSSPNQSRGQITGQRSIRGRGPGRTGRRRGHHRRQGAAPRPSGAGTGRRLARGPRRSCRHGYPSASPWASSTIGRMLTTMAIPRDAWSGVTFRKLGLSHAPPDWIDRWRDLRRLAGECEASTAGLGGRGLHRLASRAGAASRRDHRRGQHDRRMPGRSVRHLGQVAMCRYRS